MFYKLETQQGQVSYFYVRACAELYRQEHGGHIAPVDNYTDETVSTENTGQTQSQTTG